MRPQPWPVLDITFVIARFRGMPRASDASLPLTVSSNGNDGNSRGATGASRNLPINDDSSLAADLGIADGDGTASGNGREIDGDSIPLGKPVSKRGRKRGSGAVGSATGSGDGGGSGDTSSRRGNDTDSSSARTGERTTAETGAGNASQGVPREVNFRSLRSGKSTPADIALTAEFIAEGWGILFQGASLFTRDPEWKLEQDDAAELSARTVRLLKSLDQKSADKLEKKIAKYAPSLSLAMALVAVVGPRVAHTRQRRRDAFNIQAKGASRNGGSGDAAGPSIPSADTAFRGASPVVNGEGNGNGERRAIFV